MSCRSFELTHAGTTSKVVTPLVNHCPSIDSTDASEPNYTATVPPFDLLLPPAECAKRRRAGGYSPPMPSNIPLIQDNREWEDMDKAQSDKMIHDTNTCYSTKICSGEQEPREEWQDEHQTLEQEGIAGAAVGNPAK